MESVSGRESLRSAGHVASGAFPTRNAEHEEGKDVDTRDHRARLQVVCHVLDHVGNGHDPTDTLVVGPIRSGPRNGLRKRGTVFLVLVGVTVKALFAILAWRISNTISRDILSHPGEKMSCSISSHQLECLLFRVLGVYFVFPNIGVAVSNAVAFQERIASGFSFTYVLIELISVVGVIILGVFLIGKPSVWVNLLRSLRNLGHPKPADGNAATSEDSVGSNDDPE